MRLPIRLLILLATSLTHAQFAPAQVPAATAAIHGRVIDAETGRAVPYASVGCDRMLEPHRQEVGAKGSDGDGRFAFENLAPGAYEVYVAAASEYPAALLHKARVRVDIDQPDQVKNVTLRLERGLSVSGRVFRPDGRAAANARVYGGAPDSPRESTATDAEGRFTLTGFLPGPVELSAANDDNLATERPIHVDMPPGGVDGVELVLVQRGLVEGTLVDRHNQPIANAPVLLMQGEVPNGVGQSDEAGTFRITYAKPGEFRLIAAEGKTIIAEMILQVAELETVRNVRLIAPDYTATSRTVSVRVSDTSGRPLENAHVYANILSGAQQHQVDAPTNVDGVAVLDGLRPTEYQIHVDHPYFTGVELALPADNNSVDVSLVPRSHISGQVFDAETGEPIPNFTAVFYAGWRGAPPDTLNYGTFFEDENGHFRLDNVAAGSGMLCAAAEGYAVGCHVLDAPPGETVSGIEIRLRRALIISGTVTTSSGEPIVNAIVYPNRDGRMYDQWQPGFGRTDDYGRYAISLQPDTAEITAYHPAYGRERAAVHEPDIVLAPSRIEGMIRLNGSPVAATIDFHSQQDNGINMSGQTTTGDGQFVFPILDPGRYQVDVHLAEKSISRTDEVVVAPDYVARMTLDFYTGAEIAGHIDLAQYQFEELYVSARLASDETFRASAKIKDDGSFRFSDLAPGTWRVILEGKMPMNQAVWREQNVTVRDGEQGWLELSLRDGGALNATITGAAPDGHGAIFIFTNDAELEPSGDENNPLPREAFDCCYIRTWYFNARQAPAIHVPSLEPGRYKVVGSVNWHDDAEPLDTQVIRWYLQEVQITEGQTTDVTFNF